VYQWVATSALPGGHLTAQALVDFQTAPGPVQFAVIGGTGRYATPATVSVRFGPANDQVALPDPHRLRHRDQLQMAIARHV